MGTSSSANEYARLRATSVMHYTWTTSLLKQIVQNRTWNVLVSGDIISNKSKSATLFPKLSTFTGPVIPEMSGYCSKYICLVKMYLSCSKIYNAQSRTKWFWATHHDIFRFIIYLYISKSRSCVTNKCFFFLVTVDGIVKQLELHKPNTFLRI